MATNFGMIRDLARIEQDVRREANAARNSIYITLQVLGEATEETIRHLLEDAMANLNNITGD